MVTCGYDFSAILTSDGSVYMCGSYADGCLGIQPDTEELENMIVSPGTFDLDTPRKIAAGQSNQSDGIFRSDGIQKKVDFIEAGDFHMLAITEGILFSWGKNSQGQLGIGTFRNMTLPVKVGGKEKFGSDVRIASVSQGHSLILTENRELWSFGNGDDGRFGLGNMSSLKVKNPRLVENHHFGTGRISVINAGESHSAALTEDGKCVLILAACASPGRTIRLGPRIR